jgi:hypothetical protein
MFSDAFLWRPGRAPIIRPAVYAAGIAMNAVFLFHDKIVKDLPVLLVLAL